MKKIYFYELIFIAVVGVIYLITMLMQNFGIVSLFQFLLYILFAHGITVVGFIIIVIIKSLGNAFYKPGYNKYGIYLSLFIFCLIAVYFTVIATPNVFDISIEMASVNLAVIGLPFGGFMGNRYIEFE